MVLPGSTEPVDGYAPQSHRSIDPKMHDTPVARGVGFVVDVHSSPLHRLQVVVALLDVAHRPVQQPGGRRGGDVLADATERLTPEPTADRGHLCANLLEG